MDWIILTIFEYIFTFFVETASFEIVFPKGGCFIAQIIGRCYNANINKFLKDEYYGAAEPPVRCGESHLSGLTEPLRSL